MPLILCLTLVSCAGMPSSASDPIDALVTKLNSSNGLWINGIYPIIELPSDATPDQVLTAAVKMTGFDSGHMKSWRILDVRKVDLVTGGKETFSAALVESDLGAKILLFRPERNGRWWTRFYDVPKKEQNQPVEGTR